MNHPATSRAAVILAGGSGERFWPLSRQSRPKQLLKLGSSTQTLLEEAVERLVPLIPRERIYIVTARRLTEPIRAESYVPPENVLGEPCKRNTAGALIYAAAHLLAHYGAPETISMAVVTADHRIGLHEKFRNTIDAALTAAEEYGALTTIGIEPTHPETGYGYIHGDTSAQLKAKHGAALHRVKAFHEKPNRQTAERFLAQGGHYWNSGMFFWRVSDFLAELERVRPQLAQAARDIAQAITAKDEARADAVFAALEDISIDYALMEHAKNVLVVRATFPWDDVGAWTALDRSHPHDPAGNVAIGDPILHDSRNCIVVNEAGPDNMAVSVVGMDGAVVVVTQDAVLVIPKDKAQDVRHAVQELKKRNAKQV